MKGSFSIAFHGKIDDDFRYKETIDDLRLLINESFKPDLMSGVHITGQSLHINIEDESLTIASRVNDQSNQG